MRIDVNRCVDGLVCRWTLRGVFGRVCWSCGIPPCPAARANSAQDQAPPQGGPDERRLPLFGKITAIHDSSMDVLDTNGDTISVKFNGQTQFRKDRQPAKRTDFKVGDIILVRGQEAADHSWTAEVVAARSLNGQGGPGSVDEAASAADLVAPVAAAECQQQGTLGKDYVSGEIKSVDAPKLTVLRSDNVTQTLELNEETSMRKGRDSITMADIQAGDHIFARGALENNVFVPKNVMVIGPEQWKRMQEFGQQAGAGGGRRRQQGGQSQEGSSGAADTPAPQRCASDAAGAESAVACARSGPCSHATIRPTNGVSSLKFSRSTRSSLFALSLGTMLLCCTSLRAQDQPPPPAAPASAPAPATQSPAPAQSPPAAPATPDATAPAQTPSVSVQTLHPLRSPPRLKSAAPSNPAKRRSPA